MRLIRRARDTQFFDALAAARLADSVYPLAVSDLGRAYYEATLTNQRGEYSFAIEHEGKALAAFVCDVADGRLGRYGMPAELVLDRGAPDELMERAMRETLGEIRAILKNERVAAGEVLTSSPGAEADLVSGALLSAGFLPTTHLRAQVDLRQAAEVEKMLRKGHRQAVRWGRENLGIEVVDRLNASRPAFESFRRLHCDVSGRATRNDASWNVMFDAVAGGRGRLVLSRLDGNLIGGTLALDSAECAVYASGAYRRELFDKPLAHYPLVVAMERSAQAGLKTFDIGDVSLDDGLSPKEIAIAYFKRGFTNRLKVALRWSWSAPPPSTGAPTETGEQAAQTLAAM